MALRTVSRTSLHQAYTAHLVFNHISWTDLLAYGRYPSYFPHCNSTGVGSCRKFRKIEIDDMTDVRWTTFGIIKNEILEVNFFSIDDYTIFNAVVVF